MAQSLEQKEALNKEEQTKNALGFKAYMYETG